MTVSNEVVNEPENTDTVTQLGPLGSPARERELLGHPAGGADEKPPASTLTVFFRLLLCTHLFGVHRVLSTMLTRQVDSVILRWQYGPATARMIWLGYSVR